MPKTQNPLSTIQELEETMTQFGQTYQEHSLQNQEADEEIRSWNSQARYLVSSEEQEIVISQLVTKLGTSEWLRKQQLLEISNLKVQLDQQSFANEQTFKYSVFFLLFLVITSLLWYLRELIYLVFKGFLFIFSLPWNWFRKDNTVFIKECS